MKHIFVPTAIALAAALVCAPGAESQEEPPPAPEEPRPTFEGEVELVTVDVVVTDEEGRPVTGLTVEDFTVKEEGEPQGVSSFEAVELPASPSDVASPRPRVSTNMLPRQRASRSFLVFFDDVHLTPQNAPQAKGAIASFLRDGVREGDQVSLLATSGDAWWTTRLEAGREDLLAILRRLEGRRLPDARLDRMSDWEAMRITQYGDTLVGRQVYRRFQMLRLTPESAMPSDRIGAERMGAEERDQFYLRGINDMMVETRAAEAYSTVRNRGLRALSALERALESLIAAKGRKAMILVSDGFILDTSVDGFKDVLEAARRSNVIIYFLNTRGLHGLESLYGADLVVPIGSRDMGAVMADLTQESAGSEHLANDTGGFVIRNTNDLTDGIQRIARESLSYYLLGYTPSNTLRDGKYRKIEVEVQGRELNVRARKGYYAPGDSEGGSKEKNDEPDADMQMALDSPYFSDEIPMRMTAYVRDEVLLGRAQTLLATEIDVTKLAFRGRDEEGRRVGTLNVLLVLAPRESSEVQREDTEVEIVLRPDSSGQPDRAWYAVTREFQLASGWYQAKVVVRDAHDRKLGTVAHEFEVPELGQWRVSTPVLSDRLQEGNPDSPPAPQVMARRRFAAGGSLFCQFDVYGAEKGMVTGMPRVSAGYTLLRADGTVIRSGEPTAIRPTSLGYVSRLWAMGLGDVEPGDYELVITVTDEIAGRDQTLREPFTVTPEPAPVRAAADVG